MWSASWKGAWGHQLGKIGSDRMPRLTNTAWWQGAQTLGGVLIYFLCLISKRPVLHLITSWIWLLKSVLLTQSDGIHLSNCFLPSLFLTSWALHNLSCQALRLKGSPQPSSTPPQTLSYLVHRTMSRNILEKLLHLSDWLQAFWT